MKNKEPGMTLIVKTVTRLTLGLILIYGVYIALENDAGPGGGFAGGVIIALAFINLMLAFGKDEALKIISLGRSIFLAGLGAALFLFTALSRARPWVVLGEGAITLMVAAGLFAMFTVLVSLIGENKER